jgi:hypothetical protein
MKITKKNLENIIREEINNAIAENTALEPTLDQLVIGNIEVYDPDDEALWDLIKAIDARIKTERLKGPTKLLPRLQAVRKDLVKRYEETIEEQTIRVLKEFMSPFGLYADESKEIFKKYLEQGVDENRSRALAAIYGPLIFGVQNHLSSISHIVSSGKITADPPITGKTNTRTQVGDDARKVAKTIGNALGALAYASMRGGDEAVRASMQSRTRPLSDDLVDKLRDSAFNLADGIFQGKSNIVAANAVLVAKEAAAFFNTIEQSGYRGAEGLSDYFKQTVQNAVVNPSLESAFFTKEDFESISAESSI